MPTIYEPGMFFVGLYVQEELSGVGRKYQFSIKFTAGKKSELQSDSCYCLICAHAAGMGMPRSANFVTIIGP